MVTLLSNAALYLGDSRFVLATFPDNYISAVVCDPPYGLSIAGMKWDTKVPGAEMWAEVFRAMKPGAHLSAFGGSRTYHHLTIAIENAGFEIRDSLMWLYPPGVPKSPGGTRHGWGTALKPSFEPIVLARKPLVDTVARNIEAHGAGALNIDACRIPTADPLCRSLDDKGRWPANLLFHSEAAVQLEAQIQGASRYFFCAKSSSAEREAGLESLPLRPAPTLCRTRNPGRPREVRNSHPTPKPIDVMRWLVRLLTPPLGTVLDPFMGSGSTGIAAALESKPFIGIEREADYFEIAEHRIRHWTKAA